MHLKLLIITLFCSMKIFPASATVLEVKSMQPYANFEGVFKLVDPLKRETFALLDCQSFFQKLDFKQNEHTLQEYYLTLSECRYLYQVIQSCLAASKTKCVSSDDIFNPSCSCPSAP